MEGAGRPPVAQALPPQPVPVEPDAERFALEQVGCGVMLAVVTAVLLLVLAAVAWIR